MSYPSIILQYAEYPSAVDYLRAHPGSHSFLRIVSDPHHRRISALTVPVQVIGLFEGLLYLHTRSPPVIHGNVNDVSGTHFTTAFTIDSFSQATILVTSSGIALLCNFGSSHIRQEVARGDLASPVGDIRFLPPERLLSSRQDERSDVYSLAMTIYALGVQSKPFEQLPDVASVVDAVKRGKRPLKRDSLGGLTGNEAEQLWSLITNMWDQDPRRRPTASIARGILMQTGLSPSPSSTIQHSIRFPRHLHVNHSEYFAHLSPASVASIEVALDDVRLFRSNLLLLSRAETARVITGIQAVCRVPRHDPSFVLLRCILPLCLVPRQLLRCGGHTEREAQASSRYLLIFRSIPRDVFARRCHQGKPDF
jgi:hypothetical protein